MKDIEYFVEATRFEERALQTKYEKDYKWDSDGHGFGCTAGYTKYKSTKWPTVIDFRFATVGGVRVCFYYSESHIVNWKKIEKYMTERCPIFSKKQCDANNFHNVLWLSQDKSKKKK